MPLVIGNTLNNDRAEACVKLAGVGLLSYGLYSVYSTCEKESKQKMYQALHHLGFTPDQSNAMIKLLDTKIQKNKIIYSSEGWRSLLVEKFSEVEKNISDFKDLNIEKCTEKERNAIKQNLKVFFPEIEQYEMNGACYRKFMYQLCQLFKEKNEQYVKQHLTIRSMKS